MKKIIAILVINLMLFLPLSISAALAPQSQGALSELLDAPNLKVVTGKGAAASDKKVSSDLFQKYNTNIRSNVVEQSNQASKNVLPNKFLMSTDTDYLELNETLGEVFTGVDASHTPMLQGRWVATAIDRAYQTQTIQFPTATRSAGGGKVIFGLNEFDQPGNYLHWTNNETVYDYVIQFEPGLKSSADGTNTSRLKDYFDRSLNIAGREYKVVDAKLRPSRTTSGNVLGLEMTLTHGAAMDEIGEGQVKTYALGDKLYKAEAVVVSEVEQEVLFKVNGQDLPKLRIGELTPLNDGTVLGVRDIIKTQKDVQQTIVRFYIAPEYGELRFQDDNILDDQFSNGVFRVNGELQQNVDMKITSVLQNGAASPLMVTIDRIIFRLNNHALMDGNVFLKTGESISQTQMFPDSFKTFFDLKYEGNTNAKPYQQLRQELAREYSRSLYNVNFEGDLEYQELQSAAPDLTVPPQPTVLELPQKTLCFNNCMSGDVNLARARDALQEAKDRLAEKDSDANARAVRNSEDALARAEQLVKNTCENQCKPAVESQAKKEQESKKGFDIDKLKDSLPHCEEFENPVSKYACKIDGVVYAVATVYSPDGQSIYFRSANKNGEIYDLQIAGYDGEDLIPMDKDNNFIHYIEMNRTNIANTMNPYKVTFDLGITDSGARNGFFPGRNSTGDILLLSDTRFDTGTLVWAANTTVPTVPTSLSGTLVSKFIKVKSFQNNSGAFTVNFEDLSRERLVYNQNGEIMLSSAGDLEFEQLAANLNGFEFQAAKDGKKVIGVTPATVQDGKNIGISGDVLSTGPQNSEFVGYLFNIFKFLAYLNNQNVQGSGSYNGQKGPGLKFDLNADGEFTGLSTSNVETATSTFGIAPWVPGLAGFTTSMFLLFPPWVFKVTGGSSSTEVVSVPPLGLKDPLHTNTGLEIALQQWYLSFVGRGSTYGDKMRANIEALQGMPVYTPNRVAYNAVYNSLAAETAATSTGVFGAGNVPGFGEGGVSPLVIRSHMQRNKLPIYIGQYKDIRQNFRAVSGNNDAFENTMELATSKISDNYHVWVREHPYPGVREYALMTSESSIQSSTGAAPSDWEIRSLVPLNLVLDGGVVIARVTMNADLPKIPTSEGRTALASPEDVQRDDATSSEASSRLDKLLGKNKLDWENHLVPTSEFGKDDVKNILVDYNLKEVLAALNLGVNDANVLIGGPCANRMVDLLSLRRSDNCAEGFKPDSVGAVRLRDNEGTELLIVAGYSGTDTSKGASALLG